MNVGAIRSRVPGRVLMVVIPLITLLAASGIWNIRQYQLIKRLRQRELAAERQEIARATAEALQAKARLQKKAEWAASDARLQQLYREIDNLSRINEHMLIDPVHPRNTANVGPSQADRLP